MKERIKIKLTKKRIPLGKAARSSFILEPYKNQKNRMERYKSRLQIRSALMKLLF